MTKREESVTATDCDRCRKKNLAPEDTWLYTVSFTGNEGNTHVIERDLCGNCRDGIETELRQTLPQDPPTRRLRGIEGLKQCPSCLIILGDPRRVLMHLRKHHELDESVQKEIEWFEEQIKELGFRRI